MKRLYRSRTSRRLAGICGGIGHILGIDPNIVRLAVVFLLFATGIIPMVAAYAVGWIIVPDELEEGIDQPGNLAGPFF